MIFARTGGVAGRVGRDNAPLAEPISDFLRDVMGFDVPGRILKQEGDWRAAYESDSLTTLQGATSAQDGLYEQVHVIRRGSFARLVGTDWLDEIAGRVSYAWLAAKDGGGQTRPPGAVDTAARSLARINHACACRNKVRHHREAGVRARFVVLPSAICEVYWTGTPRITSSVDLLRAARDMHGFPFGVPNSPEAVAYLSSIAEEIHASEPTLSDEMNHSIRSSDVCVLIGSAAFIDNLDGAFAVLLDERFPSSSS